MRAYHGVTIAAGSLTGLPIFHADFDLPIAGILHTDAPHYYRNGRDGETEEEFASRLAGKLEAMIEREGADTIAAFIAEPVMGAGGVIVPPKTYFGRAGDPAPLRHRVHRRRGDRGFGRTEICGAPRRRDAAGHQLDGEGDHVRLHAVGAGTVPEHAIKR